jgi:hypothetical protein
MLWCIICKSKQASSDVLVQRSMLHKGLIKYSKVNGITPMTIHVQIAHPRLFVQRKQQLSEKVAKFVDHVQQSRKKKIAISLCAINSFFWCTNLFKKFDK